VPFVACPSVRPTPCSAQSVPPVRTGRPAADPGGKRQTAPACFAVPAGSSARRCNGPSARGLQGSLGPADVRPLPLGPLADSGRSASANQPTLRGWTGSGCSGCVGRAACRGRAGRSEAVRGWQDAASTGCRLCTNCAVLPARDGGLSCRLLVFCSNGCSVCPIRWSAEQCLGSAGFSRPSVRSGVAAVTLWTCLREGAKADGVSGTEDDRPGLESVKVLRSGGNAFVVVD